MTYYGKEMRIMKKHIGFVMALAGAHLWEKGGFWNDDQQYENLTVLGKIGYKLCMKGLALAGVTKEDIVVIQNL